MPRPTCIYCPTGVGSTRDHVPPKGFFQTPIPANTQLITVPCCEECRKKDHANDEFVRNVLSSLEDTEPLDYVSKHVVPRRDRAIERSRSQMLNIMALIRPVTVENEKGEFIREDLAFSLDHPRISQFLELVGRALLFEEFDQGYFRAEFDWRLNPPIPPEVYQFAVANYPKRKHPQCCDVCGIAHTKRHSLDHPPVLWGR